MVCKGKRCKKFLLKYFQNFSNHVVIFFFWILLVNGFSFFDNVSDIFCADLIYCISQSTTRFWSEDGHLEYWSAFTASGANWTLPLREYTKYSYFAPAPRSLCLTTSWQKMIGVWYLMTFTKIQLENILWNFCYQK